MRDTIHWKQKKCFETLVAKWFNLTLPSKCLATAAWSGLGNSVIALVFDIGL